MMDELTKTAIKRFKTLEPKDGYYLAFSGGKDSVVIKALADMAEVKYEAVYRVTSVDPPELVEFIAEKHPDVKREIPLDSEGKAITMWNLIPKKKMPPTRKVRYCCVKLKESGGKGRLCVTGVRWEESISRARTHGILSVRAHDRDLLEDDDNGFVDNGRNGMVLLNDNALERRMVEHCFAKHKTTLNPIIEWKHADVWSFIRKNNIPYCVLYKKGRCRLGCLVCPMATRAERRRDLELYPTYKDAYLLAFQKMLNNRDNLTTWRTAEDVMRWWIEDKNVDGQMVLDGFEKEEDDEA